MIAKSPYEIKQSDLKNLVYYIIRFTNNGVQLNVDNIIDSIKKTITKITNCKIKTLLQQKECKAPFRGFGGLYL